MSPEFVNWVETLNLNTDDKINLLLTKAGLKPASKINFFIKREYEEEKTELISEDESQKALNQPEERFIGEIEIFQKVANKYGISFEDARKDINYKAWVETISDYFS